MSHEVPNGGTESQKQLVFLFLGLQSGVLDSSSKPSAVIEANPIFWHINGGRALDVEICWLKFHASAEDVMAAL